jgi:hypothetical protein
VDREDKSQRFLGVKLFAEYVGRARVGETEHPRRAGCDMVKEVRRVGHAQHEQCQDDLHGHPARDDAPAHPAAVTRQPQGHEQQHAQAHEPHQTLIDISQSGTYLTGDMKHAAQRGS